ncbi:MAG TPA: hypothetical protein PKI14_12585 [Fervidobacterium sp.]|nr:hypothetical protein [Fervidobacterium sp.]
MAWYYGTYSCGHEGRVNIIGKERYRQSKADSHFSRLCPECYKKKKQEENAEANAASSEKAKELGLPELKGTEKQVAWANTLRQQLLEKFEAKIKEGFTSSVAKRHGITEEKLRATLQNILSTKTDAKWYIDNRDIGSYQIIEWMEQYDAGADEPKTQEPKKLETKTVMPENCEHKEPAIIKLHESKVIVEFPRNDKFREIVKNLGFTWGSCWVKEITKYNGPARDRAVELGNKLLNAGFPINMDAGLIDDAVSGNYKPEQKRWIKAFISGEHEGKLSISWVGYDDDLYRVAKKLPSAKWTGKSLAVKVNYWQEVEDFANLYGFSFSDGAKELIEKYKLQDVDVVTPTAQHEEKAVDGLKKILSSSDEVLDDLREEGI